METVLGLGETRDGQIATECLQLLLPLLAEGLSR